MLLFAVMRPVIRLLHQLHFVLDVDNDQLEEILVVVAQNAVSQDVWPVRILRIEYNRVYQPAIVLESESSYLVLRFEQDLIL